MELFDFDVGIAAEVVAVVAEVEFEVVNFDVEAETGANIEIVVLILGYFMIFLNFYLAFHLNFYFMFNPYLQVSYFLVIFSK